MTLKKLLQAAPILLSPVILMGQGGGVSPSELVKPLKDSWPTYNGDYSGKRYSALKQIDRSTVKHLTLAWMIRMTPGASGRSGRGSAPIIVGGEGTGDFAAGSGSIKASVLEVDGVLYLTMPDNAWAVDARDGRELWHYFWKTKGGTHIGNRGLAMWNNYLFMETPDDYLVSLDAKTGKERWHKPIANFNAKETLIGAPGDVARHRPKSLELWKGTDLPMFTRFSFLGLTLAALLAEPRSALGAAWSRLAGASLSPPVSHLGR
jgi:alcohol dehydrogenase (cytochrome c)